MGRGSTGLGLHIVHNVVTSILGGAVSLHSTAGRGTAFTLLLPGVAPAADPAVAA
jgi:signal transduction histidine kinase